MNPSVRNVGADAVLMKNRIAIMMMIMRRNEKNANDKNEAANIDSPI